MKSRRAAQHQPVSPQFPQYAQLQDVPYAQGPWHAGPAGPAGPAGHVMQGSAPPYPPGAQLGAQAGAVRLNPPAQVPPKPRKKRGEDGFRTSRTVLVLSFAVALLISVLAGGIGRPVAGMAWVGYVIGFAVLWLVSWVACEVYARHRWQVKHRGRRPLRDRTATGIGTGYHAGRGAVGRMRSREQAGPAGADPYGEDGEDGVVAGDQPYALDQHHSPGQGGPTGPQPVPARGWPEMPAQPQESAPAPPRRADAPVIRVPLAGNGPLSPEWQALAEATEGFVPGDDTDLIDWLSRNIRGAGALAAAYVTVFEACVTNVGLTTAAMGALHDTGDATAQLADLIAQTRRNFTQYYEGYREWAAAGGQSPHSGHFITGIDPE